MIYESLIKVVASDPQPKRERDILEGLSYVAVLLIDEYGWSAARVRDAFDHASADAEDRWEALQDVRSWRGQDA